jgi:hypothetical protein
VQKASGISKGQQTESGFSAGRTTRRFVRIALGLKLQGVSAALQDRAGCLDIPLPAIVAEDSIMANAHQSRRKDMQAEAPDELQGGQG